MKNSITLLLLLITATAFSQRGLGFYEYEVDKFFCMGVNAGVYANKIQGKSFTDHYEFNYGVRGWMQFNFSRKFGAQPEIGYNQASAKQSADYRDIWNEISSGGDQLKVKLSYLKFGGLINYDLGATTTLVKLQFGGQWGMLLSEKVDSLATSRDIFKKGEFSLTTGIMLQSPTMHCGARFEQGLTNINAIDDRDTWKNQSIQLFAGLTF